VPTTSPSDLRNSAVSPASGGSLVSEPSHTDTATAPPRRMASTAAAATRSRPRRAGRRGASVGPGLRAPILVSTRWSKPIGGAISGAAGRTASTATAMAS
jgi:hypothetical protein